MPALRPGTQTIGQAVAILGPRASRKSWLAYRHAGIGASDMAAVLGISPFASPYSLWWEKKQRWESEDSESMEHGRGLEDYISKYLTKHLDPPQQIIKPPHTLYRHRDIPWMLATPDRLLWDGDYIPLEFKTDEGGVWGPEGSAEIPRHHQVQVTQQMAVFGAPYAKLVRFCRKKVTWYLIPFDDVLFGRMVNAGERFMQSLTVGTPPEVDGHHATTDAIKRLCPDLDPSMTVAFTQDEVDEFAAAKAALKAAKERVANIENFVRAELGGAGRGMTPDGEIFVTRSVTARRAYTVKETVVDKLIARRKSE